MRIDELCRSYQVAVIRDSSDGFVSVRGANVSGESVFDEDC